MVAARLEHRRSYGATMGERRRRTASKPNKKIRRAPCKRVRALARGEQGELTKPRKGAGGGWRKEIDEGEARGQSWRRRPIVGASVDQNPIVLGGMGSSAPGVRGDGGGAAVENGDDDIIDYA